MPHRSARRTARFRRRCAAIAAALALVAGPYARADDLPLAAALKATYLTKFPPFVAWPGVRDASETPFTICVLDDERIAGLMEIAETKPSGGSPPLVIQRLAAPGPATQCKILFIGSGADRETTRSELAAVLGAPVLTVTSDAPDGSKGIINFVVSGDRMRFEIDDAEAARHRLEISSKLLSLAVSVKPR